MNQEKIAQALADINDLSQYLDSQLYIQIITIIVTVFVSVVATYFVTRIKKSAEIREVTANLDEIKAQLSATTEITERIKYDIEHDHWREKEIELAQRKKLEEYLFLMTEYIDITIKNSQQILFHYQPSDTYDSSAINIQNAEVLVSLYFKELLISHYEVKKACNLLMKENMDQRSSVLALMGKNMNNPLKPKGDANFQYQGALLEKGIGVDSWCNLHEKVHILMDDLTKKASSILEKLNK